MISPGSEIGGFVIESIAGKGGMGVVFRARQRQPERVVALKVISSEFADDPLFRTRFQREAAIAAQIEHPNVIPVHAVGEEDGTLYLVMRFVEGVDMRTLLVDETRLEPRRAAAIVDQVAHALDAAHSRGLVHRDVKPANILLSTTGGREHVYLSDFGLSRRVAGSHGVTRTGAFLGTVDYVAPEQARGEAVDARADVYSLGCVLFQALTGTVPFDADNEFAKLYAHSAQPAPSVLERQPGLPAAFGPVVARALAKDPDDRYPSAGDLGRAAIAAAAGHAPEETERSVAVGEAAPAIPGTPARSTITPTAAPSTVAPTPAPSTVSPTAPSPETPRGRRRLLWPGVAAGLVAVAVVLVLVLSGGGGSSPSTVKVLTLAPVQAQTVPAIQARRPLQTVSTSAPGGYAYKVMLDTVDAPTKHTASTPLPLYLTLLARKGAAGYVTVQRLQLPSAWRWTASSIVASFTLDPNPDGSGQLALSWFVKAGDRQDVTHYMTIGPQGIQLD